MDDNYIIITINGTDYYIEADRLGDLAYIGNKLVNVSNSSITLVSSFDIQNTYPRISCSAMQQCRLQTSNQVNYTAVTDNYQIKNGKFNVNSLGLSGQNNLIIILLFILVSLKLLNKR